MKNKRKKIKKLKIPFISISLISIIILLFGLSVGSLIWGFVTQYNLIIFLITSVVLIFLTITRVIGYNKLKRIVKSKLMI